MAYKVLVVDDEPQIHTFMRISLEAEGFEYISATSIATALKQYQSHQPHLIVLDLACPMAMASNYSMHCASKIRPQCWF